MMQELSNVLEELRIFGFAIRRIPLMQRPPAPSTSPKTRLNCRIKQRLFRLIQIKHIRHIIFCEINSRLADFIDSGFGFVGQLVLLVVQV